MKDENTTDENTERLKMSLETVALLEEFHTDWMAEGDFTEKAKAMAHTMGPAILAYIEKTFPLPKLPDAPSGGEIDTANVALKTRNMALSSVLATLAADTAADYCLQHVAASMTFIKGKAQVAGVTAETLKEWPTALAALRNTDQSTFLNNIARAFEERYTDGRMRLALSMLDRFANDPVKTAQFEKRLGELRAMMEDVAGKAPH